MIPPNMASDRRRRTFLMAGRLHDRALADNNSPDMEQMRIATPVVRRLLAGLAMLACAHVAPGAQAPPAAAPSTLARIDDTLARLQETVRGLPEALLLPGPDRDGHSLEEDIRLLLFTQPALERIAALRAAAAATADSATATLPDTALNPLLAAMTEQVCRVALLRTYWSREATENAHRDLIVALIRQLPEDERSPAFEQLQALPASDRQANPLRQRIVPDVDCTGIYRSPAQIAFESGAPAQMNEHNALRQQLAQRVDSLSGITSGALAWTPRAARCPAPALMTSGDERPRVLNQPDVLAYYPPRLRDQYVEGVMRVGVRIDPGGCVTAVMIRQSSGAAELDQAGMRLVFDMQFTPPEQEGRPVGSSFILPVRFSMAGAAPAQP